jgi:hypothetical protein
MDTTQSAWLRRNHPELASRWAEPGKGSQMFRPSPQSHTEESAKPGVAVLPRLSGMKRDFGPLTPSSVARHSPKAASEHEAMSEGNGVEALLGSRRGEKMSLKDNTTGFALRDARIAARKRV